MSKVSDGVIDVAILGGGPAGMMAAIRAAERGKSVVLIEKNRRLGKKLSITGGGRCNVTNNKQNVRDMLERYKDSGKFLFSTFSQHGVAESIDWFTDKGVSLHEENEGRLFPDTNDAETICKTLEAELKRVGVTVLLRSEVRSVEKTDDVFVLWFGTGELLTARACVISTGGRSRPDTGSTGDGFTWANGFGHTVHESSLALVPLAVKEDWIANLSGVTLPDCKVTVLADEKKQTVVRGKVLCTHTGLSGPTILNLGSTIGQLLSHSRVSIVLDLFPDTDEGTIRTMLHELLEAHSNQKIINSLSEWLPKVVVKQLLDLSSIDGDTKGHAFASDDRKRFVAIVKSVPLSVSHLLGANKAVISGGGVALEEIDFKTMQSRFVPGLYFVGDTLAIDRPSGGYSLQLCWSTGWVAGNSV